MLVRWRGVYGEVGGAELGWVGVVWCAGELEWV